MNHRRIGKIARLPAEVREQVNLYIHQGWEYPRIIDWLDQSGHPGINSVNLTKWRQGGYEDWLKHCERLEELELKLQYASEVALQADPSKFQDAALNLTCLQFFEMLNRFDPCALIGALHSKPEKYPALVNSIARFTREFVGLQRFRTELQDRAELKAQLQSPNLGGLSPETVIKMLHALRLRYPAQFQTLALAEPQDASVPDDNQIKPN